MSDECIFCGIVAGRVPSTNVYEDDHVVAFLDIGPIVKGHTLVIPRDHYESIMELPTDSLQAVVSVVQTVAKAQIRGLGCDGVNVTQANGACAGQVVPHIHFHVIPRYESDGHSWNWRHLQYGDSSEMAALAEKIRDGLD